jgi:hypothetical protein
MTHSVRLPSNTHDIILKIIWATIRPIMKSIIIVSDQVSHVNNT